MALIIGEMMKQRTGYVSIELYLGGTRQTLNIFTKLRHTKIKAQNSKPDFHPCHQNIQATTAMGARNSVPLIQPIFPFILAVSDNRVAGIMKIWTANTNQPQRFKNSQKWLRKSLILALV
jgi:hypothetical protein